MTTTSCQIARETCIKAAAGEEGVGRTPVTVQLPKRQAPEYRFPGEIDSGHSIKPMGLGRVCRHTTELREPLCSSSSRLGARGRAAVRAKARRADLD